MSAVRSVGARCRGPLRVAAAATGVAAIAYLAVAVLVVALVSRDTVTRTDNRLGAALTRVVHESQSNPEYEGAELQTDDASLGSFLLAWMSDGKGVIRASNTALVLPVAYRQVTGPETIDLDGRAVRIRGSAAGDSWVVVGQSTAETDQAMSSLLMAGIFIGLALLVLTFAGALAVGRRVAAPLERAHQRQLDFTADASHELRTPLAVIEAQAALALERPRSPEWYAEAFGRVATEGRHMRRQLEDLLWLARLDASTPPMNSEPVDLGIIVTDAVDRFAVLAESRDQRLTLRAPAEVVAVTAPPEWLDRLLGVLLDNACKYTPTDGEVRVSVGIEGGGVRLEVADSGPGIPPEARAFVLDRFHRASTLADGAGLGLAIGDAVVRATGGQMRISTSDLGGAAFVVLWPRASFKD